MRRKINRLYSFYKCISFYIVYKSVKCTVHYEQNTITCEYYRNISKIYQLKSIRAVLNLAAKYYTIIDILY
jgi:hypothetical protein